MRDKFDVAELYYRCKKCGFGKSKDKFGTVYNFRSRICLACREYHKRKIKGG